MKLINKQSFVILMTLILGLSFTACSTDEETVIVPKTFEQYKTELQIFVTNEKELVNAVVIGYNKGNFKTTTSISPFYDSYKAAFLSDLNAAQVVLNKTDLTISDIVKAQGKLTENGKLFHDALWISDRRALNDLIVEVSALNTNTQVGTTTGTVSQEAKVAITDAVTAAKSVRDAGASIQRVVDDAVTKLDASKKTFMAAIIK